MFLTRKTITMSCRGTQGRMVSSALVKELRERSGAPMMDCKKALTDDKVNGDIEKALNWLRMKGISKAAQSGDRAAHDGLIALLQTPEKTTLLEVSSETDFVGKNPKFHSFVATIANTINQKLGVGAVNIDELMKQAPVPVDASAPKLESVREALGDVVSSIRENIVIRRATNFPTGSLYAGYAHQRAGIENLPAHIQLGRTVAVVALQVDPANADKTEQVLAAGRKLAMHVVAASPTYLRTDDVPTEVLGNEIDIFRSQSENSGKKPEVLEKMIQGKLNKRLSEICLLGQPHMAEEGSPVVAKHLEAFSKSIGSKVSVKSFTRWTLGGN